MILRLSQKLNTKIKAGKLTEMPLDQNRYADWSDGRDYGFPKEVFKRLNE
jgi:hypothetical protein